MERGILRHYDKVLLGEQTSIPQKQPADDQSHRYSTYKVVLLLLPQIFITRFATNTVQCTPPDPPYPNTGGDQQGT
jgi:hypothetical protein